MDGATLSFLEQARPIGLLRPVSLAASGTATSGYISLKGIGKLAFLVLCGAGAGTFNVELLQATAVAGTSAKALAFTKAYVNGTANSTDVWTKTTVAANALPLTPSDGAVIDIDPSTLDTANSFDCVAVKVTETGGAAAQLVSVWAIAKHQRWASVDAGPDPYAD